MFEGYIKPEGIYLLSHSVGPMHQNSVAALQSTTTQWQTLGGDAWPKWMESIQRFHSQLAALLNVEASEICAQPAVSNGLHHILASLGKHPSYTKKRKVMIHKDAFPSLGFVIQGLGLDCLFVDSLKPECWQTLLEAHSDEMLAAIITHAHSNTGEVSTVKDLTSTCHQHSVFTIVDIAQSVGILPIDLTDWNVDAAVGSCVKWLSGGTGAGFLMVKSIHIQNMDPDFIGWFSHSNPFEFDIKNFEHAKSAWRFFGGTPSILPIVCANAAIEKVLTDTVEARLRHTRRLQECFLQEIDNQTMLQNLNNLSGTICLPLPSDKLETTVSTLTKNNVKFDSRGLIIRLSFGVTNSQDDVFKVARFIEK